MAKVTYKGDRKKFTVLCNTCLRDKRLSLKTKGLLAIMLSLPDEWNFNEIGLAKYVGVSRDCIRTCFRELEVCKYLKREQIRENGKFKDVIYTIYENPYDDSNAQISSNYQNDYKDLNLFQKPSLEEVTNYCNERRKGIDPEKFFCYYESIGWKVNGNPIEDWKACMRTWEIKKRDEDFKNGIHEKIYL